MIAPLGILENMINWLTGQVSVEVHDFYLITFVNLSNTWKVHIVLQIYQR